MYKVQSLKKWFFAQCTKYKARKNGFSLNVQSTKPEKMVFCSMYKVQSLKNSFFAQCTKYKAWRIGFRVSKHIGKVKNDRLNKRTHI